MFVPEAKREIIERRRITNILLMLLRMGLIALLAIALARPWASGGLLANLISKLGITKLHVSC